MKSTDPTSNWKFTENTHNKNKEMACSQNSTGNTEKFPVENEDTVCQNLEDRIPYSEYRGASPLPSDVESDGEAITPATMPTFDNAKIEDPLSDIFKNLKVSKTEEEDEEKAKMKSESLSCEKSLDKSAKELSNILQTLSLAEKKDTEEVSQESKVISIVKQINECLKDKDKATNIKPRGTSNDPLSDIQNDTEIIPRGVYFQNTSVQSNGNTYLNVTNSSSPLPDFHSLVSGTQARNNGTTLPAVESLFSHNNTHTLSGRSQMFRHTSAKRFKFETTSSGANPTSDTNFIHNNIQIQGPPTDHGMSELQHLNQPQAYNSQPSHNLPSYNGQFLYSLGNVSTLHQGTSLHETNNGLTQHILGPQTYSPSNPPSPQHQSAYTCTLNNGPTQLIQGPPAYAPMGTSSQQHHRSSGNGSFHRSSGNGSFQQVCGPPANPSNITFQQNNGQSVYSPTYNSPQIATCSLSQQFQGPTTCDTSQQIQGPPTYDTSQQIQGPPTYDTSQQIQGPPTYDTSQQIQGPPTYDTSQQIQGPPTSQQIQGPPTYDTSQQIQGPPTSQQIQGPPTSQQIQGPPTSQQIQGPPTYDTSQQIQGPPTSQRISGSPTSQQFQGPPTSQQIQGPSAYTTSTGASMFTTSHMLSYQSPPSCTASPSNYTFSPSSTDTGIDSSPRSSTSELPQQTLYPNEQSQYSPVNSPTDSGFSGGQWSPCNPDMFNSDFPSHPSSKDGSSSQTNFGIYPGPRLTGPTNGLTNSHQTTPYPYSFDYVDEDGDGILHIMVLFYEKMVRTGQQKVAQDFLELLSKQLNNPHLKEKIDQQNNDLQTALYMAVKRNLVQFVEVLIKAGANTNIQAKWQAEWSKVPQLEAPLHVAVSMGMKGYSITQTLVDCYNTDVNIQNTEGETPLHVAAREHGRLSPGEDDVPKTKSCIQVIQLLLDNDAKLDVKDFKSKKTPLMVAIESKDVKLVELFLKNCEAYKMRNLLNDYGHGFNTCMHLATGLRGMPENMHVDLVHLLIKNGGEVEAENNANFKAKDFAPNVCNKVMKLWR